MILLQYEDLLREAIFQSLNHQAVGFHTSSSIIHSIGTSIVHIRTDDPRCSMFSPLLLDYEYSYFQIHVRPSFAYTHPLSTLANVK
jgi:hypothetical protein